MLQVLVWQFIFITASAVQNYNRVDFQYTCPFLYEMDGQFVIGFR